MGQAPLVEHAVVLVLPGCLDRSFHGRGAALREIDPLPRRPRGELGKSLGKPAGRLRRKVVGHIDDALHLCLERVEHPRVTEAEVDALMRASQVEDAAAVGGLNPAAVGGGHGDRGVAGLSRPALHHVAGLAGGEVGMLWHGVVW